jgi:cytochrome c-type biogenesis protein CcmE
VKETAWDGVCRWLLCMLGLVCAAWMMMMAFHGNMRLYSWPQGVKCL